MTFYCYKFLGFFGRYCEKNLFNCELECQNGGMCRISYDNHVEFCECQLNYTGYYCELARPNPCDFSNCAENYYCKPTKNNL